MEAVNRFFLACFAALLVLCGKSQNTIGLPDITNYSKDLSRTGAQNRQVRQGQNGVLYFANNEGVLSFDGIHWRTYPLPNKSIVRSLGFGPDNQLYVGGQDEFGYLSPGPNGLLQYRSLKSMIPAADRSFTDVWQICFLNESVFFQTSEKIYQITGSHVSVYKSNHWEFMSTMGNRLVAQDVERGMLFFENGIWKPLLDHSDLPQHYFATSLTMVGNDTALLTTQKHGAYYISGQRCWKLNTPFMQALASKNISASLLVNENEIAIGTNLDGCHIIDRKGNLVRSFTKKDGLQNNNILDVFMDREKNLWLGLDNGIDFIAYNNAIKHIYPDFYNVGSGYAAMIHNNRLYIGTSSGLYQVPLYQEKDLSLVKGIFTPVSNTKGQVWNLSEVNGKLLLGHHEGAYEVVDQTAVELDHSAGFWTFQPMYNIMPARVMITGTYLGIRLFDFQNQRFLPNGLSANFESARFVVTENDNIWVAHPYKGIYKVMFRNGQPLVKQYTQQEGVASNNGNYIFRVSNRLVLTTENGIFEYDASKDRFSPSAYFNNVFGAKKIRYMREDASGNVWFVFDKTLGVAELRKPGTPIIYFPELNNRFVAGFEFIYPVDQHNILIGGDKGFYHLNYQEYKKIRYPLQVLISSVNLFGKNDSLLFGGYTGPVNGGLVLQKQVPRVSYAWNSLHFEFAAPVYGQQSTIEYSYILEGFDEKWSEYSKRTDKEYTNLSAGTYTFRVKARNNLGTESAISSFQLIVLPPWYQSVWARILYVLMAVGGIYLLARYQKKKLAAQQKKHFEEQQQLQYLHQLEMDKAEKELVKLRNEKLEAEIQHKNTELASTAMHLVQKGELLGKVKEQVVQLKKNIQVEHEDGFKKIMRTISEEDKMDNQWEQFAVHFDTVHSGFLNTLKQKFPGLTPNELKLSAYLRMNLSTKEIAQLMNISVRGVEISRYRLRKKLGIPKEASLFNFLIEVTR